MIVEERIEELLEIKALVGARGFMSPVVVTVTALSLRYHKIFTQQRSSHRSKKPSAFALKISRPYISIL